MNDLDFFLPSNQNDDNEIDEMFSNFTYEREN
jgi:hypothetical protein